MEIVDELLTPGCPQCAVKHLSAALYHKAIGKALETEQHFRSYMIEACIAYINLVEVRIGYHSHLWYAVGALVRAEELRAVNSPIVKEIREARLLIEQRGMGAVVEALELLYNGLTPSPEEWAIAHFREAKRELPKFAVNMSYSDLIGSIEAIRKEFFNLPPSTVPGEENNEQQKGKETTNGNSKVQEGYEVRG